MNRTIQEELSQNGASDTASDFGSSARKVPKWMEIVQENEEMLEKERQANPFRRTFYSKVGKCKC